MAGLGDYEDEVGVPEALLGPRSCSWVALVDDTVVAILLLPEPRVESVIVGWLQSSWTQLGLCQMNEEEYLKEKLRTIRRPAQGKQGKGRGLLRDLHK